MKVKIHCSMFISGVVEVELEPGQTFIKSSLAAQPAFLPVACVISSPPLENETVGELALYAQHLLLQRQYEEVKGMIQRNHAEIVATQRSEGVKA